MHGVDVGGRCVKTIAIIVAAGLAGLASVALAQEATQVLIVPADGYIADNAAAQGGACQKVCDKVAFTGWEQVTSPTSSVKRGCESNFGHVEVPASYKSGICDRQKPMKFNGVWTNTPPAGTPYAGKGVAVCGCVLGPE